MNNWRLYFKDWMAENRKLSEKSLNHYVGAIKNIFFWVGMDFSNISSLDTFDTFKKAVLENPTFVKRDEIGNNMYSVALRHFEEFVKADVLRDSLIFPEIVFPAELYEGSKKTVTINAYERNSNARKQCIQHYGDACAVCGFRFADVFGEDFEGIIHVHHIKPFSEISKKYIVDPIKDLIPVCPNCHLVIHSKPGGTYTIREVQELIKKR